MECHRCPHREEVEAGKYAKTPFGRTPCAKCELRENSSRTMEFDEDRPATGPDMVCEMNPFAEESDVKEDKLPVSVLTDLLVRLMALPRELRDIVCWRFVGLTYPDIAKKQRVTGAGVEARHRRAMRMFPELRQLFIVKTAKRKMRKRNADSRLPNAE
jgi:hypothetical protein